MERRINKESLFKEVPITIDYMKLRTPTYVDRFSKTPRWENNASDQFICTAQFLDSYLMASPKEISRSRDNMLPVFFTYESDSLPLGEQLKICNKVTTDSIKKNYVFSQTFSGSKSIHTLVWIKPEFRKEVAQDFKYYWAYVARIVFGDDSVSKFDSQCASIGRLSRNPNGVRDNKVKQVCIYYNGAYEQNPINLENVIKTHSEVLRKEAVERLARSMRQNSDDGWKVNDYEKLERIYKSKKVKSESFNLAYEVLIEDNCPKGADYVGAAASLKGCGFGEDIIRELLEKASNAHPTNISPRSVDVILSRLLRR